MRKITIAAIIFYAFFMKLQSYCIFLFTVKNNRIIHLLTFENNLCF